jgi:hypothetical protein
MQSPHNGKRFLILNGKVKTARTTQSGAIIVC